MKTLLIISAASVCLIIVLLSIKYKNTDCEALEKIGEAIPILEVKICQYKYKMGYYIINK